MYKDETGRPLPDRAEAFCDLWTLDEERERALRTTPGLTRANGLDDAVVEFRDLWMNALRNTQPRLLAYLACMVERLLYGKPSSTPRVSVYLHCGPAAIHYSEVMRDAIFDPQSLWNASVWKRTSGHSDAKRSGSVHDVILAYTRSGTFIHHRQ